MRRLISSGSVFEAESAIPGRLWRVTGCLSPALPVVTTRPRRQAPTPPYRPARALRNIEAALARCDARESDVVRVADYVLDAQDFGDCWPLPRDSFGQIRPAATMLVVAGLGAPECGSRSR